MRSPNILPAAAVASFLLFYGSTSSEAHNVLPQGSQSVEGIPPYMYETPSGGYLASYCGFLAVQSPGQSGGETRFIVRPVLAKPLDNRSTLVIGNITANPGSQDPKTQTSRSFNLGSGQEITMPTDAKTFKIEAAVNKGIEGGEVMTRKGTFAGYLNLCPSVIVTLDGQELSAEIASDWTETTPPFLTGSLRPELHNLGD